MAVGRPRNRRPRDGMRRHRVTVEDEAGRQADVGGGKQILSCPGKSVL